jgi:hypothetical protein
MERNCRKKGREERLAPICDRTGRGCDSIQIFGFVCDITYLPLVTKIWPRIGISGCRKWENIRVFFPWLGRDRRTKDPVEDHSNHDPYLNENVQTVITLNVFMKTVRNPGLCNRLTSWKLKELGFCKWKVSVTSQTAAMRWVRWNSGQLRPWSMTRH